MITLKPLSFSKANVSNLRAWTVRVQPDRRNSSLCSGVQGDYCA